MARNAALRALATLSLLWLAAVPALADERYAPLAQMPFETADTGSPVIPMQVNGQGPFWFVLDTGATGTTVRHALVERLKPPRMAAQVTGIQGMGGTLSADLHRLDRVAYGPLEARDIVAPVFARPELRSHAISGVAGIDVLRNHAVEFDFRTRSLRLHNGFRGGRGWRRIPARFNGVGYAFVPVAVNGVAGTGFIDTGATVSILNPAFVRALGWRETGANVRKEAQIGGVEGARIPLYTVTPRDLRFAGTPVKGLPIHFADVAIFSRLAAPGARVAIIGADILARQRFVIDYPHKAVWLHAP